MIEIPSDIRKQIANRPFATNVIGKSKAQVLTFSDMVLKIEGQNEESDNEHIMMQWLSERLPVPKIIAFQRKEGVNYLLMRKIKGEMACSENYLVRPKRLVQLLVQALHMLWEVAIPECPCDNSIETKLRKAAYRVENGMCDTENVEPGTYGKGGFASPAKLLRWLEDNKPEEQLAFSHGDFCLPNVFFTENRVSGFLDLGRSGAADRYQDIALCCRSLNNNYNGKYNDKPYDGYNAALFFDALGITPDWERIRYYILLDELF